ncbi:MAG: 50S ribosomal protein L15 [Bdellovibrionaceae bacterium]|nr:50S ribosomal protein L15 [Pseudobdellovibrionaceae bacterium]|tara:strand:+ start:3511 stop:3951 length:441 start_codon:yes stop_codon:yes gene_type:complete
MSALSSLKKFKGSTHKSKALGRGVGSGKGGTSTKGHKGQKARKGGAIRRGFEGGQTPMARRLPKFGFSNVQFANEFEALNLDRLQKFSGTVGPEELQKAGLARKGSKIKIMGRGEAPAGLSIKAHKFTETAKAAIEKAGGQAEVIS